MSITWFDKNGLEKSKNEFMKQQYIKLPAKDKPKSTEEIVYGKLFKDDILRTTIQGFPEFYKSKLVSNVVATS